MAHFSSNNREQIGQLMKFRIRRNGVSLVFQVLASLRHAKFKSELFILAMK